MLLGKNQVRKISGELVRWCRALAARIGQGGWEASAPLLPQAPDPWQQQRGIQATTARGLEVHCSWDLHNTLWCVRSSTYATMAKSFPRYNGTWKGVCLLLWAAY